MEGWMKALACAGYDFMKLMVAELQRQLDDLEGKFNFKYNSNKTVIKMDPVFSITFVSMA
jgi:hypothetical protein